MPDSQEHETGTYDIAIQTHTFLKKSYQVHDCWDTLLETVFKKCSLGMAETPPPPLPQPSTLQSVAHTPVLQISLAIAYC